MKNVLNFQTYTKQSGLVVAPGAWVFHKGLTFPKRKNPSKLFKDLYGIWYVTTQLGNLSEQSFLDVAFLSKKHPKWFKTFQQNLNDWLKNATPEEWIHLEAQDPSGKLRKLGFEKIAKTILNNGGAISGRTSLAGLH